MKIKILRSCAGEKFSFVSGQVVDAPAPVAEDLIQAGHAEVEHGKSAKPTGKRASKRK
jgi:hypothetical protein